MDRPGPWLTAAGMEKEVTESSPLNSVTDELDQLQAALRATLESYALRLETEINEVRAKVEFEKEKKKVSHAKMHDVRDMLTLLRNSPVKADKGRRKDLKKIDSIIGDLKMLTENW